MRKVRVGIWGFGVMGIGMVNMILKKEGIEIVFVCSRSILGKSMYDVLGIERGERLEVIINKNYEEVFREKSVDVVLLVIDLFIKKVFDKIIFLLNRKINVILIVE